MTTTLRFDGRRVLVTGAGKGIGRGIAKKLAECGAEVLALSRTQADLDSLQTEVPNIVPVCVDLEDWDATRKAVEGLGPIHLLVNNAAVLMMDPFMETSRESLERSFVTNVYGAVNVSQVVAKGMIERGNGGSIVIISSTGSTIALPNCTAYCGTKGAQDSIMRVMARELGPHQIRVNSVQPTAVMTPMGRQVWEGNPLRAGFVARHPLGKFSEIEDIVDGTLYLLSDQSAMITGTCLSIDGGLRKPATTGLKEGEDWFYPVIPVSTGIDWDTPNIAGDFKGWLRIDETVLSSTNNVYKGWLRIDETVLSSTNNVYVDH